jgi:hypothetical protein
MFCRTSRAKESYSLSSFHSDWAYVCVSQHDEVNPSDIHIYSFFLTSIQKEVAISQHHHHRLYSPAWALASSSKCRQRHLPWTSARQFLRHSFFASSSTLSIHLDIGWPRPRWPPGFVHNIFLDNSLSSIRTAWSAHLSLLDFITLTVFGSS